MGASGSFLAERVGWIRRLRLLTGQAGAHSLRSLRVVSSGCAVLGSNRWLRIYTPLPIPNRLGPAGPGDLQWRRGWDSNPRRATNPCWFSRPVHSTALPPLRGRDGHATANCRRREHLIQQSSIYVDYRSGGIDSARPCVSPLGRASRVQIRSRRTCDAAHLCAAPLRGRCAVQIGCPADLSNPRRATNPCWFSRPVIDSDHPWSSPCGRASRVQIRSRRICQPLCHLSAVVTVMRRRILLAATIVFNRRAPEC